MFSLGEIRKAYLKIIGAGITLNSKISFKYSNGFLLISLMCFLLPAILVVSIILSLMTSGIEFLLTPQFVFAVLGALAAYALSVQRNSERIKLMMKAFEGTCIEMKLTANGAVMRLSNNRVAKVKFENQPAGTCTVSISVPTLVIPLSFKLYRSEIETVLSKLEVSSKSLSVMLEQGIRSLELKGFPNTRLKFPRNVKDKPGLWISAKLPLSGLENIPSCIIRFIDSMRDRNFVAMIAQAIIKIGAECDVSGMYDELLSYHKIFFGNNAKAILDKLIEKTMTTNKISHDLAIVTAWRKMLCHIT